MCSDYMLKVEKNTNFAETLTWNCLYSLPVLSNFMSFPVIVGVTERESNASLLENFFSATVVSILIKFKVNYSTRRNVWPL